MSDYISREAAIKAIDAVPPGNWSSKRYVDEIKTVPAADVREVRHSSQYPFTKVNFMPNGIGVGHLMFKCVSCGAETETKTNFCPNCGADMREGQT